jgi:ABC-type antimicrobial peptide transport system permease subunit
MTELVSRVRLLWRDAGHTLAVVLSLAIGMAVCVAVFSLVNVVVFATVPGIGERPRLVHLTWSTLGGRSTPAEVERLVRQPTRAFRAIGVLVLVSLVASAGPAYRAASVDPVRALRED